jgi:hypothetical protein
MSKPVDFSPPDPTLNLDAILRDTSGDEGISAWDDEHHPDLKTTDTADDDEADSDFLLDDDGEAVVSDEDESPRGTKRDAGEAPDTNDINEIRLLLKQERERNERLQKSVDDLASWKKEISDNALKSVLASKEAERRQAYKDQDIDRAMELEDEIVAIKQAATSQEEPAKVEPKVDPRVAKIEQFVQANSQSLDAKIRKIHALNFPDFGKVSENRKRGMLAILQQVVTEGVDNGASVDEVVADYAERLNLKTVKPVNRAASRPSNSGANNDNKGSLSSRFNSLPRDARKLWASGGYDRIYGGNLEEFVTDTEKSLRK